MTGSIILFIILILIVILVIGGDSTEAYNNETHIATNEKRFKYARPEIVAQLYKLLYVIDKIFTKYNIDYWMDGGTFLGAIRHKGLIPWDDDGDLQIWAKDELVLRKLEREFKKHNIILTNTWFGYKLYFKDATPIKGFNWSYPAIDIFPVEIKNKQLIYSYPRAQNTFKHCSHDINYLYPLKRYQFGSFSLMGSSEKDIESYFNKCYGSDWNTHAYQMYDHENEKAMMKKKILLIENEKKPAQPIEFDKNFMSHNYN